MGTALNKSYPLLVCRFSTLELKNVQHVWSNYITLFIVSLRTFHFVGSDHLNLLELHNSEVFPLKWINNESMIHISKLTCKDFGYLEV